VKIQQSYKMDIESEDLLLPDPLDHLDPIQMESFGLLKDCDLSHEEFHQPKIYNMVIFYFWTKF
jgi:hypothetical protein